MSETDTNNTGEIEELFEQLAQRWESEIETVADLSGPSDAVGPIHNVGMLVCAIELRYAMENDELPPEEEQYDGHQYTTVTDK